MAKSALLFLSLAVLQMIAPAARADTVILKSGEMFQTRKAWKEDGSVCFYVNDRVVRYPAGDVERLIQDGPADETVPPATDPSAPEPRASAPSSPITGDAGFLGLIWESSPSRIKGLQPAGTDPAYGGVKLYTVDNAKKRFGRADVDNIFLGFWQGGLYTVLVEVSNYLDFTDLKAEVFRRFGTGRKDEGRMERYRWSDQVSDRLLSYDDDAGTGYLWMRSHALHERVLARYPE